MTLRLNDRDLRTIGKIMRLVVIPFGLTMKAIRLVGKALSHAGMVMKLVRLALRLAPVVVI